MLRAVARARVRAARLRGDDGRDIATAAGLSVGSVYRLIGSKDELLESIMRSFTVMARSGWSAVLQSEGAIVEKLDALMWININAVDRFRDEYNIQLAWIRESPPNTTNLGSSFSAGCAISSRCWRRASGPVSSRSRAVGRHPRVVAVRAAVDAGEHRAQARPRGALRSPARRRCAAPPSARDRSSHSAGSATDFSSRYWSKPAKPFWRPMPLAL